MIGGSYSKYSSWYGNISDIMIFNKSLSSAARTDLYYKFASQKMGMLAISNIDIQISAVIGPVTVVLPDMGEFNIWVSNTSGNKVPVSTYVPSGVSHIPKGTIIYHPTAILVVSRRMSVTDAHIKVRVVSGSIVTNAYNYTKSYLCTMQFFPSGRSQDQLNSVVNHKGFIGPLQGPSSWSAKFYQ